jgi:proteic killer suppression protein
MIRSFRCKDTERIFKRESGGRFGGIARVAQRKLEMLNAATSLGDLRVPPNNRIESLKGNRAGRHSIRVNDRWRICFVWRDGNAENVEIVDYH